ncbi:MAG: quinate 5-dehydrogenase [Armatimonadetes bacterium]|nr:quinate 5-dehydrogenase [Armatimonadota bacterium]MBS1702419.1 quinate 5-dehydrogenase [Armatimonadota bacterium]
MKTVVSVSLGTSKRDKKETVELLGDTYQLERRGTDGDMKRFGELFLELDGKVDALGVGGADIYLVVEDRKYAFREILNLVKGVKKTPVVDGGGLKHTLERETIKALQASGEIDFSKSKVLLVSAVDRFGMAQALHESGASVVYGDFLFGIGMPIPIRTYSGVKTLGKLLLPIITKLPFKWFYPTGEKQETRTPKYPKYFLEADIICGDWHYIRKFMPDQLEGKTIITQTLRKADLKFLQEAKVAAAITTTPVINGETFATNVMEGVIVAHLGRRPEDIKPEEYLEVLAKLGWKPNRIDLSQA